MKPVHLEMEEYRLKDCSRLLTPALLVYPAKIDANLRTTIDMAGGDPNRWRPHVKTAKIPFVMRRMMDFGIHHFKCATTLELLTLCELGAADVLLAFPVVGANAERVRRLAEIWSDTTISVLAEDAAQVSLWRDAAAGIFLDINPGMDRTGISADRTDAIVGLAKLAGPQFRGLHYYDGHHSSTPADKREEAARRGYEEVMVLTQRMAREGISIEEIITSGTPVAPMGLAYEPFRDAAFVHRISPGTVVYNDTTSLQQLSAFPYQPAVLVLSTVVSHPAAGVATCDAGHKAVSVDAGVPNCEAVGWPGLKAQKPSEEHLPLRATDDGGLPALGEHLYLLPRHVCPTVNNFDEALLVVDGRVERVARIAARGHESPLALLATR